MADETMTEQDLDRYRRGVAHLELMLKGMLADLKNVADKVNPEQRWFIEEGIKFILLQKRYVLYAVESHLPNERTIFLDRLITVQLDSLNRLVAELKKDAA
jgi:hypothetical protein